MSSSMDISFNLKQGKSGFNNSFSTNLDLNNIASKVSKAFDGSASGVELLHNIIVNCGLILKCFLP